MLSDECELVSEYHKYGGFMQHKVAATQQEQRFERRRRLNTFAQMRQETLI